MLLFYLLILHFSRKALSVHDDLELELIEVIETFDLAIKQLLDFISFANNFHPAIKFTYELSPTTINFLDISISLQDGTLSSSVFLP